MEATPIPTPTKTVLLCITVDNDTVIASPAGGAPRIVRSLTELVALVEDPAVKPAKTTDPGFDIGDFFKGLGRAVAELGKDEPQNGSNAR